MADYSANTRWADRSGRRPVTLYLREATLASLDAVATRLTVPDPVTGKARKMGRAAAVDALVEKGRDLWAEDRRRALDSANMMQEAWLACREYRDKEWEDHRERQEEAASNIAELSAKLSRATRHSDTLEGELAVLRPKVAELEAQLEAAASTTAAEADERLVVLRAYAERQAAHVTALVAQIRAAGLAPVDP